MSQHQALMFCFKVIECGKGSSLVVEGRGESVAADFENRAPIFDSPKRCHLCVQRCHPPPCCRWDQEEECSGVSGLAY